MVQADLENFKRPGLKHRLLHGGLPPYFLSAELPEREFQEWMDAVPPFRKNFGDLKVHFLGLNDLITRVQSG